MSYAPAEFHESVAKFAICRDWDQFHTPKNLAMALAGEVGELVEVFRWLTPEEPVGVMSSPRR
jgi:NTP pyrophosphatase (non-canonical NTP hydrolase)